MQWIGNLLSWIGFNESDVVNTIDNDGDINMSNDNKDIDYMTYKPGDIVYYKDIACKVIEIHHAVFPPRATIRQIIDGKEINTEFIKLISEKEFVQSQNDSFTKQIFDEQASESLLAIPDNEIKNENKKTKPKSNSKKSSPVKSKKKTKSKKKSRGKKKKHIAQIQRRPKKSKRRQKVVKRKNSKKKSRSAKTNSRSAKRNLKKVKKKKLASKTVKMVKGSKSIRKTPKKNLKKRRLTEIGIENDKNNDKIEKKNKIKSPPKKRRRMTLPININDAEKLVERIYGERIHNGNIEYLMKWKGYKKEESTWEQDNGSETCKESIKQFKIDLENEEKKKYMKRVVREINSKYKN
eukprot:704680_1